MTRKLVIAVMSLAGALAIGTTLAWAASGGGPFGSSWMHDHMRQSGTTPMTQGQIKRMMERVHTGFDEATIAKLTAQCTKAMQDGTMPMDPDDMGGMMGSSGHHGMMGSGGTGGMMGGGGMMGSAR